MIKVVKLYNDDSQKLREISNRIQDLDKDIQTLTEERNNAASDLNKTIVKIVSKPSYELEQRRDIRSVTVDKDIVHLVIDYGKGPEDIFPKSTEVNKYEC